ncbi:SUR7/PalI family-domain-containing protein [Dactylonectria estremocensis]|uniref:SUR7/PalI family-domain-containing protein n=1 Tax=Dactylonectria estremocensis TaxID=1079267 RepID=A0A9P9F8Q6_9HYPO|nr:SUR7/PalI family-domain-containing protein [Dactylonectria estremocensis]
MGVGRFFCVALPFALTVGSIIFLLVGTLSGVADKSLYLFRLNVKDLTLSEANFDTIIGNLQNRAAKSTNITASDLNLGKYYDISLWNYCATALKGSKRTCVDPKFDWAASALNTTWVENFGSAAGVEVDIPDEVESAIKAFIKVMKWTEVAFVAALVALAVEIVLGIFANCSTIMSCCTWIVAGIASLLVCCAAGLATATAAIVVGAVEASAKWYGVRAKINTTFLAAIWIAAAFAIGASLFWVFTICCCKPDHSSRRKNRRSDGEKLLPTKGYAPLGGDHEMTSGNYYNQNQSQSQYGAPRGAPRNDLAYEPYSHRA